MSLTEEQLPNFPSAPIRQLIGFAEMSPVRGDRRRGSVRTHCQRNINSRANYSSSWRLQTVCCLSTLAIICILSTQTFAATTTTPSTSNEPPPNSSQTNTTSSISKPKSKSSSTAASTTKLTSGQTLDADQQATDLSSMYVQIPIAEPVETTDQQQQQQQQQADENDANDGSTKSSSSSSDPTKASTWTGPWPKKFQIGYIKQSDLHQVLIESLKNEPFVAFNGASPTKENSSSSVSSGTKSSPSATKTLTTPLPDSHSTTKIQQQQQVTSKQQQQATTASDSNSNYLQNVPQLKAVQQTPNQWQMNGGAGVSFNQNLPRPNSNMKGNFYQHQQPMIHMALQKQGYTNNQQHNQRNNRLLLQNNLGHLANNNFRQQFNHHPDQGNSRFPMINQQQHMLLQNQQNLLRHQQFPQKMISMTTGSIGGGVHSVGYQNKPQQQAIQFAQFAPSSSSFKNQPIYTINNNFNSQQQQLEDQYQLMQLAQGQQQQQQPNYQQQQPIVGQITAGRAQKSSDYFGASWRPVNSDKETSQQQTVGGSKTSPSNNQPQQQQQQVQDSANLNDGFDDGFGLPSGKDSSSSSALAGTTMNRHPILNSYLNNSTSDQTKLSPAKMLKQTNTNQKSAPAGGTKTATKSMAASDDFSGVKGGDGGSMDRRAVSNNQTTSTTTTTTTSSPISFGDENAFTTLPTAPTTTTTMSPGSEQSTTPTATDNSTSTDGTEQTSSTTASSTITTTVSSVDGESTTEPDSEVIDSETTESTMSEQETTTTATESGSSSTTTMTSTTSPGGASSSSTTDSGESEVATRGDGLAGSVGTASLPTIGQNDNDSSTPASQTREETTPSSSRSEAKGEVEGSTATSNESPSSSMTKTDATMSDEALMAAAVRATSDLNKATRSAGSARSNQQQSTTTATSVGSRLTSQASKSSKKQARSSERLIQQQQTTTATASKSASSGRNSNGSGKTNNNNSSTGNKLITKRPQSPSAASRSSKLQAVASNSTAATKTNQSRQKSSLLRNLSSPTATSAKSSKSRSKSVGLKQSAASKPAQKSQKITRMVSGQPSVEQLQRQQIVSMSADQAQSAAQTLASLLLSRCLNSANCAHLLDVCSTKQAAVAWPNNNQQEAANSSATGNSSSTVSAAWSVPIGLMSSNLVSLMQTLQADKVLRLFPAWKDSIETIVDQETQTGYTLIVPSNEAIERMPSTQIELLLANGDLMSQLIESHILDSAETIELSSAGSVLGGNKSRSIRVKNLQINQHRDRMVTINGKRVVYVNQQAPSGGRIHVIDGLLDWPTFSSSSSPNANSNRLLDIMETLRQCDKFDGFVTLAEGTGLNQILKQDGPMTVFVPSNEALRKIPDDELEVIKNNSTALKEFLMYHVVNGSYFSQDLRDGQQLASILDMRPIQVGVRVDGCSRRLVEANTSPMRRPDIVAKNGVIHILDWYLTVRDNEWCDPIGKLQTTRAGSISTTASTTSSDSTTSLSNNAIASERLQQLASEQNETPIQEATLPLEYATRMSLPANHKPASPASPSSSDNRLETVAEESMVKPSSVSMFKSAPNGGNDYEPTNSVYVSSMPMVMAGGDIARASR